MNRKLAALAAALVSIGAVMGQLAPVLNLTMTANPLVAYSGDQVNFTIVLKNEGKETLTGINLTDDLSGQTIRLAELDPQMNYTYWFVVKVHDDLIGNATACALNSTGHNVTVEAQVLVDIIHPNITLVKSVNATMIYPGQRVNFTFFVNNTGDVGINAINITDDLCGPVAGPFDLKPGENLTACLVLAIDDDVTNNGTASGFDPLGKRVKAESSVRIDVIHPNLTLAKSVNATIIYPGQYVNYTLVLENVGDCNLTAVNLTDPALGLSLGPLNLTMGENMTVCVQVQLHEDTTNEANATGLDPLGGEVEADATTTVDVIHPELRVQKSVEPGIVPAKGNVTYTLVLENVGDCNLTAVNISDQYLGWEAGPFDLMPGEGLTFELNATVHVTATNNATAVGLDPLGNPVAAWDTAHVVVVTTGDIRGLGYWMHQFSYNGRRHVDRETLEAYLALIIGQSSIFDELYPLSMQNATDYLWLGKASMEQRAVQHCLVCWLNWANGALELGDKVDTDLDGEPDMTFQEAMEMVEDLIANAEGWKDYEAAKRICESICGVDGLDEGDDDEGEPGSGKRGPPEDVGMPQGRGPPQINPPVKRGPPEDVGKPQGRGPP